MGHDRNRHTGHDGMSSAERTPLPWATLMLSSVAR
jgi:hypothetical protein